MATVTNPASLSGSSAILVQLCYGDNDASAESEFEASLNGYDLNFQWDTNGLPLDSGEVPFTVDIPIGGGSSNPASLSIKNDVSADDETTYGSIKEIGLMVRVQANVSRTMLLELKDVDVTFTNATNTADGPTRVQLSASVDAIGSSRDIALVTPGAGNWVKALVTGKIRMTASGTSGIGIADIIAKIFVYEV